MSGSESLIEEVAAGTAVDEENRRAVMDGAWQLEQGFMGRSEVELMNLERRRTELCVNIWVATQMFWGTVSLWQGRLGSRSGFGILGSVDIWVATQMFGWVVWLVKEGVDVGRNPAGGWLGGPSRGSHPSSQRTPTTYCWDE